MNAKIPTTKQSYFKIDYGPEIEHEIERICDVIGHWTEISQCFDHRWLALKLLEQEQGIEKALRGYPGADEIFIQTRNSVHRLEQFLENGVAVAIAERRYEFVHRVVHESLLEPDQGYTSRSERIDRWITQPWLGVPIFLFVMYVVFNLVVNVSAPYLDWVDSVITGPITSWLVALLRSVSAPGWLQGLVLDGIVAGVGGVLVFIPGLIVLFFFIALLEDTGYMARAAIVMDRFMQLMGLRGKSFVSLVLGFGCAVPAIYATRTLENQRDRLLTTLLVPLMSCSGRLPVYVIFGMALFGRNARLVILGLYGFGILMAASAGFLLSRTIFKTRESSTFMIELAPYSFPTLRNLRRYVTQRIQQFIKNAGTVILLASIIIWLLLNLPIGGQHLEASIFGRLSRGIAPLFAPAGFGKWEASGSLVTGLIAKEVVVSTMSQIYVGAEGGEVVTGGSSFLQDLQHIGVGFVDATVEAGKELVEIFTPGILVFGERDDTQDTALITALTEVFTPLSALAFLVFVLLYLPCVATLGTIRGEFGWKWAIFSAVYQTAMAWLLAVAVYQGGRVLGFA